MENKESKPLRIVIAAIVIGVAALGYFYWNDFEKGEQDKKDLEVVQMRSDSSPQGFPSDLSLNAKIGKSNAYTVKYPESLLEQGTVKFNTSVTEEENFKFYLEWARENNWTIVNSDEIKPVYSLYLKKSSEEINVTINGSVVTITHIKR